jgi:hypothetical protein
MPIYSILNQLNPIATKPACEHVLPVRIASFLTGLASPFGTGSRGIQGFDRKLEYEYAHNYCNLVKNDSYFLTVPNDDVAGATNWCNMDINIDKINQFLQKLYTSHWKGELDSSITYNGIFYPNIVAAGMAILYPGHSPQEWAQAAGTMIYNRMLAVMNQIKLEDKCGTPEAGFLYRQSMNVVSNTRSGQYRLPQGPMPFQGTQGSVYVAQNPYTLQQQLAYLQPQAAATQAPPPGSLQAVLMGLSGGKRSKKTRRNKQTKRRKQSRRR